MRASPTSGIRGSPVGHTADGRRDTENVVSSENVIRIMCPNLSCQRVLAVPVIARGKIVRCRRCGMNVKIPKSAGQGGPHEATSQDAAGSPTGGDKG